MSKIHNHKRVKPKSKNYLRVFNLRGRTDYDALRRFWSKGGKGAIVSAYRRTETDGSSIYYPLTVPVLVTAEDRLLQVSSVDVGRSTCGRGVNVATLEWCQTFRRGVIWQVMFHSEDIAAMPGGGKFRVSACRVTRQLSSGSSGQ